MNKLINTDLDEKHLRLANWLREEVSEFRQSKDEYGRPELLAFIVPVDMIEFKTLMEDIFPDYFSEGTLHCEFNGDDIVVDILPILEWHLGIAPELIYEEWRAND